MFIVNQHKCFSAFDEIVSVIHVIDTSAIFLRKVHGNAVTVPEVVEEVVDEESKLYFSVVNVRVEEAKPEFVSKVLRTAEETGDIYKLSKTDVMLLAKALEIRERGEEVTVVTDDYSIQNVARVFELKVESIVQPGISKAFKWVKVCRGCGRQVDGDVCPVCGSEVVLRRVKREKARRPCSKGKKAEGKGFNDGRDS